jgi:hypothetical protein
MRRSNASWGEHRAASARRVGGSLNEPSAISPRSAIAMMQVSKTMIGRTRSTADGGVGMIEVPQSEILIDATLYAQRMTHDRVTKTWREEIEAMHCEHCLISLTLHPRSDYGSARASRIAALDHLLAWVRGLSGTSLQIADSTRA